jgi:tRNA A37 N6-isopentenylltransferase MiaA
MSAPDKPTPPDFDEDFLQAIAKWREQNKIKDDDIILLLLELFRIHQKHWDELRRRQMPSLAEFRADVAVLTEATKVLKEKAVKQVRAVDLPAAIFAALAALLAGFLIGKAL